MKLLLSKESIATTLLIMLSVNAIASMIVLVYAAAEKDPNVYITGSGFVKLTWKSGKSKIYSSDKYANFGGLDIITFTPSHGWHIVEILIDGILQGIEDEDGFSLTNVQAKSMISVTFEENDGVDDVDAGVGVGSYPDPYAWVIFDNVLTAGDAYAYTIGLQYPYLIGETWDIQTDAIFEQSITIILILNLADLGGSDPTMLRMFRTEVGLTRADVNLDGVVDGTDVSIIANVNPSELGDPNYVPRLDQNDDNAINDEDVNIVNNYIGESVWEDITLQVIVDYDLGLVYIYGKTDHLSLFGIH